MKKNQMLSVLFASVVSFSSAETNALVEVKLFKDWVIAGELNFGNLAIKNTGASTILLARDSTDFEMGQLCLVKERAICDDLYQEICRHGDGFFNLLPEETHVYEGRKFYLTQRSSFAKEIRFTVSVYLGNGFWLDSEPLIVKGVVPDSEEQLATIANVKLLKQGKNFNDMWHLVAVTYKNERWLYKKSIPNPALRTTEVLYFPVCPLSLTNKIRVDALDGEALYRIRDGDKPMMFDMYKSVLTEGPDENNVLGKWTRERKQRAEADNAEVRRKKAEAQAQ